MMAEQPDLDAVRAREAAATPGPWSWAGNTDHDDPRLVGGTGRQTVMGMVRRERTADDPETKDFVSYLRETEFYFGDTCRHLTDEEIDERVREQWLSDDWGEPAFDMRLAFRDGRGIMAYARDLAVYAVCPEATSRADERVYRADIVGLRHPDAVFMEHAREDVRVLLDKVDEQACTIEWAMENVKRLKGELAARTGERNDALRVVEAFMDRAHGSGEDDGAGAGLVEDVALLLAQRDDAIRAFDEVTNGLPADCVQETNTGILEPCQPIGDDAPAPDTGSGHDKGERS